MFRQIGTANLQFTDLLAEVFIGINISVKFLYTASAQTCLAVHNCKGTLNFL
jgi:hypothetical protein